MPTEHYPFLNRSKRLDVRLYFMKHIAQDGSVTMPPEDQIQFTTYVERLENLVNRALNIILDVVESKETDGMPLSYFSDMVQWKSDAETALGSTDFAAPTDTQAGEDE